MSSWNQVLCHFPPDTSITGSCTVHDKSNFQCPLVFSKTRTELTEKFLHCDPRVQLFPPEAPGLSKLSSQPRAVASRAVGWAFDIGGHRPAHGSALSTWQQPLPGLRVGSGQHPAGAPLTTWPAAVRAWAAAPGPHPLCCFHPAPRRA